MCTNLYNFIFTFGVDLIEGTIFLKQSPYTGCWVNPRYNVTLISLANALIFETLSIGLIVYKPWLNARLIGAKTPLASLLLKDGVAHYLSFIASKLFVVGNILAPTVVSAVVLPSSLPIPVAALAVNRQFIRLRRIMLHSTPGLTNYTTSVFSAPNHRMGGDDDRGKGSTTIGGSEKAGRRMHSQGYSHLDYELLSLGGGDVGMSLNKSGGVLHTTASTRSRSTVLSTPETSGSLSSAGAPLLELIIVRRDIDHRGAESPTMRMETAGPRCK
jgi:hypothetical protein